MKNKLLHIRERFPDSIQLIGRLAAENPDFSDLCDDYNDCVRVLHHWASSEDPEAGSKFDEYLTIVHDLEEEIRQILSINSQEY